MKTVELLEYFDNEDTKTVRKGNRIEVHFKVYEPNGLIGVVETTSHRIEIESCVYSANSAYQEFLDKLVEYARTPLLAREEAEEENKYEINYIVNTYCGMEEWLNDFIGWLESRNERICGTIEPLKEEFK